MKDNRNAQILKNYAEQAIKYFESFEFDDIIVDDDRIHESKEAALEGAIKSLS